MRHLLKGLVLSAACVVSHACGANAPAAPATPETGPARFTLTGIVTAGGAVIAGARVEVSAGVNVGENTATDGAGRYSLPNLLAGQMTLRASAAGFAPQTISVTLAANQVADLTLQAAPAVTHGRAVDALSGNGYGGLTIAGDVIGSADSTGAFSVAAASPSPDPRLAIFTGLTSVERRTNVRVPGADILVTLIPASFDLRAFDEMFRVPMLLRWTTAPPLIIETRTLQFTSTTASTQTALADQMTDAEVSGLLADLTWALPQLTGGSFDNFAGLRQQTSPEGAAVNLLNGGSIFVTRTVGLTAATGFWGYSRWRFNSDGTITGGIITLDRDFERSTSAFHRSLRSHELGHALGYNHVTVRASVMNTAAVIEPNAFDLDACRIAFQRTPGNRTPDNDPSPGPPTVIRPRRGVLRFGDAQGAEFGWSAVSPVWKSSWFARQG